MSPGIHPFIDGNPYAYRQRTSHSPAGVQSDGNLLLKLLMASLPLIGLTAGVVGLALWNIF